MLVVSFYFSAPLKNLTWIPPLSLSQRPFLWSAGGLACGLCGPAAASSVSADVYRLCKCKHFLRFIDVLHWVLFRHLSKLSREGIKKKKEKKNSTCKALASAAAATTPRTLLLFFLRGEMLDGECAFELVWIDWRASFIMLDTNGAC